MAGALERRVYTESSMSRVYANLYVLLVAPPGVGKSVAIFQGRNLLDKTEKLYVSPDDVTKAALIDHLERSSETKVYPKEILHYHCLQVVADEFGVLVPSHDTGFLSVMNALYDGRSEYKESRRGREDDIVIKNPLLNMLAGTQPDFLANLLPPEAWGMGFMSRMLMVYAGKSPKPKLFGPKVRVDTTDLLEDLKVVCELHGEMVWEPEAETELVKWYTTGLLPEPEHTKLKHYVPRRILTTLKLCMVSCASRGNGMAIGAEDVVRAREWLLEIEALMPDVFKDMNGQSDIQVIQDLHYYIWDLYMKSGETAETRKPLHRSRIDAFLMARTPSYNIENIVKLCKSAKVLIEAGPDFWKPGNVNNLRME